MVAKRIEGIVGVVSTEVGERRLAGSVEDERVLAIEDLCALEGNLFAS